MHGFVLLFCVFPVMWTVFYACFEVYRLLAFGQSVSILRDLKRSRPDGACEVCRVGRCILVHECTLLSA
jgi:hypothetical protein